MLDLRAEFTRFEPEIRAAIDGVLQSQCFIGGPAVAELEAALCGRFELGHAVAVSSGTDALVCSLMALDVGPGDEVIVPSFTFFATAGSVARVGAVPVFADIDATTFNLDPESVEHSVTERTRAIIAVHMFGQCADMDAIRSVAVQHDLAVIEDAAQAVGARLHDRHAGTLGDVACFSFYPTKNLGGFGEGGLIATADSRLAETARQLRNHGESTRYHHDRVGGNFRLDSMKAAILLVKLRYFDEFAARRRAIACLYDDLLAGSNVRRPALAPGRFAVYHQYTIRTEGRDAMRRRLQDQGVPSAVYYPLPLHLQKCFAHLGYVAGSLPETEKACRTVLSLPCHPMLSDQDVAHVAEVVCRAADERRAMSGE